MPEYVPLRDREDLPDEVRQILSVRRHVGNPWTEEDALVVARWRGYEPSEPWPGNVGIAWRGVCVLGHECGPNLSNVLAGRPPCGRQGHVKEDSGVRKTPKGLNVQQKKAQTLVKVAEIAKSRGDEVVAAAPKAVSSGKIGTISKTHLTLKYPCGHQTGDLVVPADVYIARKGMNCMVCRPTQFIRGMNELARLRPDIVEELVDPSIAWDISVGSTKKVEWRCRDCGHVWPTTVASRTVLNSGCPDCAHAGGYDLGAPGSLYVVRGVSVTTREVLIKVGISNVPDKRLYVHSRQGLTDVLSLLTWSDGIPAAEIERRWVLDVRKGLPSYLRARKRDLLDGYREAVIDSNESRSAIHSLLREAVRLYSSTLTAQEFDPAVFLPPTVN